MLHNRLLGWTMVLAAAFAALLASGACVDDATRDDDGSTSSNATSGSGGSAGGGGQAAWLAVQGQSCPPEGCPGPLECVTYCGFAGCGGQGQSISSCEIRCNPQAPMCPDGQVCVTIADGPGEVCVPQ